MTVFVEVHNLGLDRERKKKKLREWIQEVERRKPRKWL